MTIYLKSFTYIFFICLTRFSIAQNNNEIIHKEIDKILKYEFSDNIKFPDGYSIAVIDGDSSWIINYGHHPYSDSILNEKAYFELSGLSKIISSSYLLYLENQNKLDLDQPFSNFQNLRNIPIKLSNITMRHIMNHTSGLPKFIKYFQTNNSSKKIYLIDFQYLIKYFDEIQTNKDHFQYSHHNYALIQWFLEDYFDQDIKSQINSWLKNLKFDTSNLNNDIKLLTPGVSKMGKSSNPLNFRAYWSSLGMNSNILFMKNFIQNFSLPQHRHRLLSGERIIQKTDIDKHTFFIDGWYGLKLDKKRYIYSHAGRSSRHKVSVQMLPETSTAVIIFSNSELGTFDLGIHILKMINDNWNRR